MPNYLFSIPNNTSGLDPVVIGTITSVPSLAPFLLVFVWMFVFVGGVIRQRQKSFNTDYAAWACLASLSTLIVALLMSIVAGFISLSQLITVLTLNLICGVWLFLDRRQSEV